MCGRAIFCVWALLAFGQPDQQAVAVFADPAPPPPTLAALLGRASLIVVGRVDAAAVRAWGRAGSVIDYRVAVLEVLREHSARVSSSNINVVIFGGTVTGTTGKPVRTHGPPQLEIGHIGIFVLSYWPGGDGYTPVLSGYFELQGDSVTIPEVARHMPEFGGRTTLSRAEFLALMKGRF